MKHPKGLIPIVVVIFITIIAAGVVGMAWYYSQNKHEDSTQGGRYSVYAKQEECEAAHDCSCSYWIHDFSDKENGWQCDPELFTNTNTSSNTNSSATNSIVNNNSNNSNDSIVLSEKRESAPTEAVYEEGSNGQQCWVYHLNDYIPEKNEAEKTYTWVIEIPTDECIIGKPATNLPEELGETSNVNIQGSNYRKITTSYE